jgi:hypothetical protein
MASKYTAETAPYESSENEASEVKSGSEASYTPDAAINPLSYGKDGGKANAQGDPDKQPPSVVVGGSSTSQAPPAMPGTLKIGDNKNVSTPVSG